MRPLLILVMSDRRQEIARIGQAVGPDRPAVWQRERIAVILADVGPRGAVDQLDAKNDAARNDADLARRDLNDTELGSETQAAVLCHHQQLAVGIEEVFARHRLSDE